MLPSITNSRGLFLLQHYDSCHIFPVFQKQLRRSEVHLTELFEDVCERMDDYAQGHWKDTEEKDLLPIIVNGQMNPRMSEFELLKDSNLNRGIKDYVSSNDNSLNCSLLMRIISSF